MFELYIMKSASYSKCRRTLLPPDDILSLKFRLPNDYDEKNSISAEVDRSTALVKLKRKKFDRSSGHFL